MNKRKKDYTFDELLDIIKMLRSENGCPWDRAQTHDSIKGNLIEEAYEAVEALDSGNKDAFADELGDVLLQVVFHSQIAESENTFTITDVLNHICNKMISRHTHIFGSDKADTAEEVLDTWEKNKQKEKGLSSVSQSMRDVCHYLPALLRSQKVLKKAAKAGFDWNNVTQAAAKLREETDEVLCAVEHNNPAEIEEELGDMLFAAVNVARFVDFNAENALNSAVEKFISRFEKVEDIAKTKGHVLSELSVPELEQLWKDAKNTGNR